MKNDAITWFIVSRNADGSVSSDSWLAKWGRPSEKRMKEITARVPGIVEARLVRQGDVETVKAELAGK